MSPESSHVKIEGDAEVCVKEEAEDEYENEFRVRVKEEGESEDAAGLCNLYVDHQVKDELVLGPEELHQPVPYTLPVAPNRAEDALVRACSVRLERLLVDAERRSCRVGLRTYTLSTRKPRDCSDTSSSAGYLCNDCGKSFRHKLALWRHIYSHLPEISILKKQSLEMHSNEHSLTNLFVFSCGQCEFTCRYARNLRQHQWVHTRKKLKCSFCNYECSTKVPLRNHELRHTRRKTPKPSLYDFKFSEKQLQSHQITNSGETGECNHNDYTCTQHDLRDCQIKHTIEKTFVCNICDYKTNLKEHLIIHHKTHTTEQPFICSYTSYYKRRHHQRLRSPQTTVTTIPSSVTVVTSGVVGKRTCVVMRRTQKEA